MKQYNELKEKIILANEDIVSLKRGCEVVVPRGNSDKEWKIKTYITGYSEIPTRIGRKLNKDNTKFIPVLQEYRTKENELNINTEIRVDDIIEIIGRPINLCDCLIAIEKKELKDETGDRVNFEINSCGLIVCDLYNWEEEPVFWIMGKPLQDQPEETIELLYNLICKK